jgi:hypothetical protein
MEVAMKARFVVFAVLLGMCALSTARAGDPVLPPNADKPLIEKNLLIGLASQNKGLQRSSALMLGHIKSERAVVPLMAVLKDGDNPDLKIAAAWALCNIGDARGTFVVRREVEFNNCCKTRLACAWYYETMVKSGSFVFKNVHQQMVAIVQK